MPYKIMTCVYCKKLFEKYTDQTCKPKYCSKQCMANAFKKQPYIKKCITCGNAFSSSDNRRIRKRRFCSTKCIRYQGNEESLKHRHGKGFWQIATEDEKLKKIKQLFEKTVIKNDGCWGWSKSLVSGGYTRINVGYHKGILGHRASWLIYRGSIPEGRWVLHTCDNRVCTNPDHLYLGTPKNNSDDMIKRNRKFISKGIDHYNVKLTIENVLKIRELRNLKYSLGEIASLFKVKRSTIQNIIDGKTWKHIK